MARHAITIVAALLALLATFATFAADSKQRIKKCQDAQGRWHYGDEAADACARSQIIELDTRGLKRGVVAAPLTEAELKAREATIADEEKAKKLAEQQKRRDDQLRASYALEDDINVARDRKLADINAQIRASEETLASLRKSLGRIQGQAAEEQRGGKPVSEQTAKTIQNNEAQVAKHEAYINSLKKEQETVRAQFQADLDRFRELKSKPAVAPAEAPKP